MTKIMETHMSETMFLQEFRKLTGEDVYKRQTLTCRGRDSATIHYIARGSGAGEFQNDRIQ